MRSRGELFVLAVPRPDLATPIASALAPRAPAEDVLHSPCGGHRSVTAFVVDQRLARSLLTTLGLAAEPAIFAPARVPPQVEFAWDGPA